MSARASATVLLRRSSLGDVVLLGASTAALAARGERVVVVTAPAWVPVAQRLRGVADVVPWPDDLSGADLAKALPLGRWVDLHRSLRSRAVLREAPSSVAVDRLNKRSVRRRVRVWLGLGGSLAPVGTRYAEACGVAPAQTPWIEGLSTAKERDTLVLVPGARWATKRWSPESFSEVGEHWDGRVVVLGGPGEETLCAHVAAAVGGGAEAIAGPGFDAVWSVMERATAAVCGDTGLMHLAAACGVPVVAIFASTHPDDGFFGHRGEVVQRALSCRPCTLHGRVACPLGDAACLKVAPAEVTAALQRVTGDA